MLSIRDADIDNKRVFLRVDFNVPMEDKRITDDFRIRRTLPTIRYLIDHRTKIIIGTHLGKPEGQIIPQLSTIPIASDLARLLHRKVYATDHIIHPLIPKKIEEMKWSEILIIGNLRWHREEEENNYAFARDLASYADIYVNDAFGTAHRNHASVEAITQFLPSYAGLLLESEITTLSLLLKNPVRPFIIVLGGAKVKDKAPLIYNLASKADKILIGGAIANTFLAAKGVDVSQSLYEPEMMEKCLDMIDKFGDKLILQDDYVKKEVPGGFLIADIGPKTRERFVQEIKRAGTVFWNGNLGRSEEELYNTGTVEIAKAMIENKGTTVVSGGDTVGFLDAHHLLEGINFVSTGGGATLHFLSGEIMPGIVALERAQKTHF